MAQDEPRGSTGEGSRVRRFLTSLPGALTGVATVVTAVATIVGILFPHHSARSAKAPAARPAPGQSATDTASAATSAAGDVTQGFRRLWGPSLLTVTNDGTDLTEIPPRSTGGLDLYDDGSGFAPMSGTRLVRWTGSSAPTPEQCLEAVRSQATGGEVQAPVGAEVCALTSGGELAIIHVLSLDTASASARTEASIWSTA